MARIIIVNPATGNLRRPPYGSQPMATGAWTPNALQTHDARGVSCIDRARHLKRTLGIKAAAAYLRNRGWSVEAASDILARRSNKF